MKYYSKFYRNLNVFTLKLLQPLIIVNFSYYFSNNFFLYIKTIIKSYTISYISSYYTYIVNK